MDKALNQNSAKQNMTRDAIRIGGTLMLICAVVALILSVVNLLTSEQIAQNEEAEKKSAIEALFETDKMTYTPLEIVSEDAVQALYEVCETETGALLGYCASVTAGGFGGDIQLMVALEEDASVRGIKVVSHSETPGLGSRVTGDTFLAQFVGAAGELTVGKDIDAISGSTISSRAVTAGVNAATAALTTFLTGGDVDGIE